MESIEVKLNKQQAELLVRALTRYTYVTGDVLNADDYNRQSVLSFGILEQLAPLVDISA